MDKDDREFIVSVLAGHAAVVRHGCDGAAAMMEGYKRAIVSFVKLEPEEKPAKPVHLALSGKTLSVRP